MILMYRKYDRMETDVVSFIFLSIILISNQRHYPSIFEDIMNSQFQTRNRKKFFNDLQVSMCENC